MTPFSLPSSGASTKPRAIQGPPGLRGADGNDGKTTLVAPADPTSVPSPPTKGERGEDGWTPVLAIEQYGARQVLRITEWAGGSGTPPNTGYIGPSGIVATAAQAVNIQGPAGAAGPPGPPGAPPPPPQASRQADVKAPPSDVTETAPQSPTEASTATTGDLDGRCVITFKADTYREITRGRTDSPGGGFRFAASASTKVQWLSTLTVPYPDCASQEMLADPGTRVRLVSDIHAQNSSVSYNSHMKGQVEGWMFLNGVNPETGMPQRLIEGGIHNPYLIDGGGIIHGCAGIDLLHDRIILTLSARGQLMHDHQRDDWKLEVMPGPRPDGDRYRCNADPDSSLEGLPQ